MTHFITTKGDICGEMFRVVIYLLKLATHEGVDNGAKELVLRW